MGSGRSLDDCACPPTRSLGEDKTVNLVILLSTEAASQVVIISRALEGLKAV